MMSLTPTKNNVLLIIEQEVRASGIVLSEEAEGRTAKLVIEEVGPDVSKEYKKGMRVWLGIGAQTGQIEIDGKKVVICKDSDIVALEK